MDINMDDITNYQNLIKELNDVDKKTSELKIQVGILEQQIKDIQNKHNINNLDDLDDLINETKENLKQEEIKAKSYITDIMNFISEFEKIALEG